MVFAHQFHITALCATVIRLITALALSDPSKVPFPRPCDGDNASAWPPKHCNQVLILGGGVAGILAARKLTEEGITDFVIVEARDVLGGRLRSTSFGAPGRQLTVELGASWIQGAQEGNGPANPMLDLARKHNVRTVASERRSVSTSVLVTCFGLVA